MENMEKTPTRKIVFSGRASEEAKKQKETEINSRLFKHKESFSKADLEVLEKYEIQKTEEEIKIIEEANRESNRLIESLGLETFNVSPDNIHFLNKDYPKKNKLTAEYFGHEQGILLYSQDLHDNPVYLAKVVFHEILHLKSNLSLRVNVDSRGRVFSEEIRSGMIVSSSEKDNMDKNRHDHFVGFDEAVVAYAERQSVSRFLKNPMFKKEAGWMESEGAEKIRKDFAEKHKESEDNVFLFASNNDKETNPQIGLEGREIIANAGSYPRHVKLLEYILKEIQKDFSDKYSSLEEVFREFEKSLFTGYLLTIARLIEKTFGEGSFRSLGEMKTDSDSAILKMETFKKLRAKVLRNKDIEKK